MHAAEDLDRIEIEKIPLEKSYCTQSFVYKRKKRLTKTSAVRITVIGVDGAEITDIWTRDQFRKFVESATSLIADG